MRRTLVVLAGALLMLAVSVRAQTTDDIIALAQKGVGEEVMVAAVENAKSAFQLSAADILKLKDGKVPDKVIMAMLRYKPAAPVPPPANVAPAVPAPPAKPPAPPVVIGAADGILNLENLDDRVWSYRYDPDSKTIWIATAAADGRGNLDAHGGLSIRMAAGSYKVRYNGQDAGPLVNVFNGEKSLVMISRVDTNELEALYATVFEKGERKATGKLVTLRDNAAPAGDRKGADNAPPERIVERERVVEVPSTTVIYRDPYPTTYIGYTYPYYSYGGPRYGYSGYYYPRYYYPSSFIGFGYSNFGHYHRGSSWSVGFGAGF